MSELSPTTGDWCHYCGNGFLLPSGLCDHCNQPPSEGIDRDWLMAVGFLPDGHPDNGDMAIRLWDITETESDGCEPAMQLCYSLRDGSLWLETYGSGGESLCLVELKPRKTRGELRQLCRELGVDLSIRVAANPCAKVLDHKWLDPACVEGGCQSLKIRELEQHCAEATRFLAEIAKELSLSSDNEDALVDRIANHPIFGQYGTYNM